MRFLFVKIIFIFSIVSCPAQSKETLDELLSGKIYGSFRYFNTIPNVLFSSNTIEKDDAIEFSKALELHPIDTLVLRNPGGNVYEALNIAEIIFDKNLTTYISKDAECTSACSFLFFGGRNRLSEGKLGVSPTTLNDGETSEITKFLEKVGTPSFVYERMSSTLPTNIYFFSKTEMKNLLSQSVPIEAVNTVVKVEAFQNKLIEVYLSEKEKTGENVEDDKGAYKILVQKELNRIGCSLGVADGKIGPKSIAALSRFNKLNNSSYSHKNFFISNESLSILKQKNSNFCPKKIARQSESAFVESLEGRWRSTRKCSNDNVTKYNMATITYGHIDYSTKKPAFSIGSRTFHKKGDYYFEFSSEYSFSEIKAWVSKNGREIVADEVYKAAWAAPIKCKLKYIKQ